MGAAVAVGAALPIIAVAAPIAGAIALAELPEKRRRQKRLKEMEQRRFVRIWEGEENTFY